MTKQWTVIRFAGTDSFGLVRGDMRNNSSKPADPIAVGLTYRQREGRLWTGTKLEAQAEADRLNGRTPLPRRCPATTFDALTGHVTLRHKTRGALHDIMVGGKTWSEAAKRHRITESGILRAMRRVGASTVSQGA